VEPLISTKQILDKKKEQPKELVFAHSNTAGEHEFFITPDYKLFSEQLKTIKNGKHYTFVSFGQWSLKHVVFHVVKLIGKCDIYSTTYGLGPTSARGIVSALGSGLIKSFNFLYDNKIRTYKIESHDICSANFPVSLASIHAKVTILYNEKYNITITGSANWSDSNDKIELTEIHTNPLLVNFHKGWILEAMKSKSVNPKKILNEIQQRNT